jgi:hypothetical protein
VVSINDVLAACVNGPQTHRIDNVHYGPIDIRVRQPYEREVSVHFELEPSHPVRRFLLFAEAKVWRVEEVDITSFAKHERSCLLQFHALCGPPARQALLLLSLLGPGCTLCADRASSVKTCGLLW